MSVRQLKAELAARDVEISHCRALDADAGPVTCGIALATDILEGVYGNED